MSCLIIVLGIELLFCGIEYIHARAVFVNPTFFAFIVITVATLFGVIGNSYWNVEISPLIIVTVFFGFLAMLLADILAKKTVPRYRYKAQNNLTEIKVSKYRSNIVIAVVVILTVLYGIDILRAGASLGYTGLSAIYGVKTDRSSTNVVIRQGIKFVMAAMFVHTFIFANNVMVLKKKGIDNYKHLIPAICAIICSIFTSVRTEIFRVITALMVAFCILVFQKKNWRTSSLRQFVKRMMPYIIIGLVLLFGLRFIVKGTENATSNTYGAFMYIAYYIGTPIIVLGYKLSDGIYKYRGSVFGELTFNRLYRDLQDIGFLKNVTLQDGSRNVWIDRRNRITANADTLFGLHTIDFGIIGMAIFLFILFYFLCRYYYKFIYKTNSCGERDSRIIVYSFLAAISSLAYYVDFFGAYLTFYFFITYLLIRIIEQYYGMSKLVRVKTTKTYVENFKT